MIKKRYIILGGALLMIIFGTIVAYTRPVLPFIQLPGEVWPGTDGLLPEFLFNGTGLTNTFAATLLSWGLILLLIVVLRARSRTADEVPTGFYNLFEMVIEGGYNFAQNITGGKVKEFFPYFMSFILIILVANWTGLIPGFDSIGQFENRPHFVGTQAGEAARAEAEAAGEVVDEAHIEEVIHEAELAESEQDAWALRDGLFLIRAQGNADENAPVETDDHGMEVGMNPSAADWTIVPFFRPASTDLNMTLAFALIGMVMVQFFGFKHLGGKYLLKFFPFAKRGYIDSVKTNPMAMIDPAVGLLELVSEFAKILSFAFRLLGNLFAGMVLYFVMAYLISVLNIAFYGLEVFVGAIQAAVFGLLVLIFMNGATEHHGDGEEEHH